MAEKMVNVESSTYVVNAEVNTFNMVVSDQVNAKASTSYTVNAETSFFYTINAEASYMVNAQTNILHAANIEANIPYENEVYDKFEASHKNMTIGKLNIGISSADDVDSFLKAYGQYNRFSIIKKRVEQHDKSIECKFGGKYMPKKNIAINTHQKEAEWNRFFGYQTLSSYVGIIPVSSEIFPTIDHILLEYLTPHILSIERIEIAQYLYFDAILADLSMVELDDDNEINQANIKEIWQITDKRPGNIQKKYFIVVIDPISYLYTCMSNISRENVVFSNKNASQTQHNQVISLIPQPLTVPPAESESEESEKKNNLTVANPPITKHRGRPETKQYKAATEKTEKTEKAHCQPYTYQSCGKPEHNSARCQKKGS
ncbi:16173_t:CDS:2 [Gigaspora margarita]|uniref:16173_t:CDS:1 n=1 Tax=Gigaspora margarita TaxID=4874 RepID=A0ABM8VVN9_GIGMA|nr:16173_t:CDS:2 [Gigaspora margarita]